MDVSVAAGFFDDQPVYDAYSGALLFYGQPDLYDLTKSDSVRGYRRTLASTALSLPARGCIRFGEEVFVVGRVIKDFFQGENHRSYVLLHPVDGLMSYGWPLGFISGTPTTAYAAETWLKDRKFEEEGSLLRPEYVHYFHPSEPVLQGMVMKGPDGRYFRVQAVSKQTGGMLAVTGFDLGATALQSVSYSSAGSYDPVTDSSSAAPPVSVQALVEFFRANYDYPNLSAQKYEKGDLTVTVSQADITLPAASDIITISGREYRVLDSADDKNGCWEIHVRPWT
jgi:hypothetical protein